MAKNQSNTYKEPAYLPQENKKVYVYKRRDRKQFFEPPYCWKNNFGYLKKLL